MGMELITVHTHVEWEDGVEIKRTVRVDEWPRETSFDAVLFEQSDPSMLSRDGDMVTITVSNGQAVYQLEADTTNGPYPIYAARLVSSRLSTSTADPGTGHMEGSSSFTLRVYGVSYLVTLSSPIPEGSNDAR